MSVPAQRFDGWYQEIPTALKGLGMTEKSESAPITVSLRGVLQSAADFSITMIAGGNHTLIKEADVAISRYDGSRSIDGTRRFPRP